jgi:hypothetical protein
MLKHLKYTSIELWRLSDILNVRFAYTMLTCVICKLILLVIDIYWIYMRVSNSFFHHFTRKFVMHSKNKLSHSKK